MAVLHPVLVTITVFVDLRPQSPSQGATSGSNVHATAEQSHLVRPHESCPELGQEERMHCAYAKRRQRWQRCTASSRRAPLLENTPIRG